MRVCRYRSAVPLPVTLLLDLRTQPLVGLWPVMVLASSLLGAFVCCGQERTAEPAGLNPGFDRCLSLFAQRWRDSRMQKIAAEEQAIPV